MALHKDFQQSPHAILDPGIRWFPADKALRESCMDKLMPPLVPVLRRKVTEFRDGGAQSFSKTSLFLSRLQGAL
jgi:type III restriction enzyme